MPPLNFPRAAVISCTHRAPTQQDVEGAAAAVARMGGAHVRDPRPVAGAFEPAREFGPDPAAEHATAIETQAFAGDDQHQAPPLIAHVPGGYGPTGFQASGVTFPTEGCWMVSGTVGRTTLTFVTFVIERRRGT